MDIFVGPFGGNELWAMIGIPVAIGLFLVRAIGGAMGFFGEKERRAEEAEWRKQYKLDQAEAERRKEEDKPKQVSFGPRGKSMFDKK